MNTSTMYRLILSHLLQISVVLVLSLTLSSCGSGLSGKKYAADSGMAAIEFKSGSKAYLTTMGQTVEIDYEIDDDKIKLKTPMGTTVLTRNDDGTITGMPMTGPLKEQK